MVLKRSSAFGLRSTFMRRIAPCQDASRKSASSSGSKSEAISPLEKDRHLYKEFSVLDEAMNWAEHLSEDGRVALLIEGDDGTRLTKQQIATALKNPDRAQDRGHAA